MQESLGYVPHSNQYFAVEVRKGHFTTQVLQGHVLIQTIFSYFSNDLPSSLGIRGRYLLIVAQDIIQLTISQNLNRVQPWIDR